MVRAISTVAATLACAALAVSCGSSSDAKSLPAQTSPIDYSKSGGIAGGSEKLHISRNGRGTVITGYGGDAAAEQRHFTVGQKRLTSLRDALAAAHFATISEEGPPSGCADCFIFTVTYRGHTVTRDQISVPKRLDPVLSQLQAILDSHSH